MMGHNQKGGGNPFNIIPATMHITDAMDLGHLSR